LMVIEIACLKVANIAHFQNRDYALSRV